jgi:hypothetical protein
MMMTIEYEEETYDLAPAMIRRAEVIVDIPAEYDLEDLVQPNIEDTNRLEKFSK